ncbi:oxidoreductase [Lentzea sp. NPDC060358]|uniref:oxidoreductase n=1 Tax=Lentzea sp. NPDC060358 TaxID=3347103 RepID=UPI003665E344
MDRVVSSAVRENALELVGRRILVTGGSRGIGRAVVARLAASGASVVASAREAPRDLPAQVSFVPADVATADGCARLVSAASDLLGGIDVLVNNAGGGGVAPAGLLSATDESWEHALQLNLLSAVRLDRAVVPGMVSRGDGSIIHITSVGAYLPVGPDAPYAAAKAALSTYSKALANEFAPRGVRVNRISPGLVENDTIAALMARRSDAEADDPQARMLDDWVSGIPLGRPGKPADVAELVAFLVSGRAAWISGSDFRVDGGSYRGV